MSLLNLAHFLIFICFLITIASAWVYVYSALSPQFDAGQLFLAQDMCGLHDCIQQAGRNNVRFVVALLLVFYLHWQGPRFDLLHHLGAQLAQADPDARHFCLLLREHMAWCVQYANWHNSCEM